MRLFCPIRNTFALRRFPRQGRYFWKLAPGACCILLALMLPMPVVSCGNPATGSAQGKGPAHSNFRVESAAFKEGSLIPTRFTCQGENVSPPLSWIDPPAGVRSFALIVEDPDAPAGTWTHWVVYNLPAQARAMDANTPKQDELPNGGLQGKNSFGSVGYGGPCPPAGKAHRYFFRLYALDVVLGLQAGADKSEVLAAMKGHVMGEAQLMGLFKR